MDKAKLENKKVYWYIKKCSYDSNLDCYMCLPNDFIYKAHLKNHKEYATNFKAITAQFIRKKRADSYVTGNPNQDTNVKSRSDGCILKVNGTVVIWNGTVSTQFYRSSGGATNGSNFFLDGVDLVYGLQAPPIATFLKDPSGTIPGNFALGEITLTPTHIIFTNGFE